MSKITRDKEKLNLKLVDVVGMLECNCDEMFVIECEAIDFIRDTHTMYSSAKKSVGAAKANKLDFEAFAAMLEEKTEFVQTYFANPDFQNFINARVYQAAVQSIRQSI